MGIGNVDRHPRLFKTFVTLVTKVLTIGEGYLTMTLSAQ
jgi:hypothetical protein